MERSVLLTPCFTDLLFFTRYSARPRLLFALKQRDDSNWCFFWSSQTHNQYEKSFVVTVDSYGYKKKFPGDKYKRARQ
ncbi:unnamed protein product [Cochlearia groenlandica]